MRIIVNNRGSLGQTDDDLDVHQTRLPAGLPAYFFFLLTPTLWKADRIRAFASDVRCVPWFASNRLQGSETLVAFFQYYSGLGSQAIAHTVKSIKQSCVMTLCSRKSTISKTITCTIKNTLKNLYVTLYGFFGMQDLSLNDIRMWYYRFKLILLTCWSVFNQCFILLHYAQCSSSSSTHTAQIYFCFLGSCKKPWSSSLLLEMMFFYY